MCVCLYIHNEYTQNTHTYIMQTKTFILDAINRLTALNLTHKHKPRAWSLRHRSEFLGSCWERVFLQLIWLLSCWSSPSADVWIHVHHSIRLTYLQAPSQILRLGRNQLRLKIQIMFKVKEAMFHSLPRNQTPLFLVSFLRVCFYCGLAWLWRSLFLAVRFVFLSSGYK